MGSNDNLSNSGGDNRAAVEKARLIPDLPTTDDAFGAHQLLARSLADLISCEEGGKAIALEGGWGSGKSSVVAMLKTQLEQDGKNDSAIHVRVFDAWSHEGDPLRRVFLEDLTQFCSEQFDDDTKERWEKRKKSEITGIAKETRQTTTPILKSAWPLLVLTIVALFTVAVAAIGGLAGQNLNEKIIKIGLVISAIVALPVPLGLIGLFIYCQWPWWPNFLSKHASKDERKQNAGSILSLYSKKIDDNVITTAHETMGPTSIEFQEYFSDLVTEYLKDGTRKLVLVLDNLDRVPARTARTLWATLRVFAECCENAKNTEWAKRTWFIVPYDPSAAKRLWDDDEEQDNHQDAESTKPAKNEDSDVNAKKVQPISPMLSAAFLDKTFQIRFDVPPLLLADWKNYLHEQLIQSIPNIDSQEAAIHRVYLLSRHMAQQKKRPPTPRHLKLYVNDIAALHRRYGNTFPIDHLALYAILRRQGHDVRLWLLESSTEHETYASILGNENYVESLCAMAHGITDIERARDLHLRAPIESALASGKVDELKRLSGVTGFWPVLEMLCDEPVSTFGTDESRVANALLAVHSNDLLTSSQPECMALKRFLESLIDEAKWKALNQNTAQTVATGFDLKLKPVILQKCVDKLASIKKDSDSTANPEHWVEGIKIIASALDRCNKTDEYAGRIQIPASEKSTGLLIAVQKSETSIRNHIASLLTLVGDVSAYLTTILPQPTADWTEANCQALQAITAMSKMKINIDPTLKAIKSRLEYDVNMNMQEVQWFIDALRDLETFYPDKTHAFIKTIVKNGVLFRRINNFQKSINTDRGAALLRWAIHYHEFSKQPGSPANAPEGFNLAKQTLSNAEDGSNVLKHCVNYCRKNRDTELLESIINESSQIPNFATLFTNKLREEKALGEICNASIFTRQYASLQVLCSTDKAPDLKKLCSELLESPSFTASLSNIEGKDETLPGLIYLVQQNALSTNDQFTQKVKQYLEGRNAEQWGKSLQSNDVSLKLLTALRQFEPSFYLSGPYYDAFESLLKDKLVADPKAAKIPNGWQQACDALPENQQDTIASKIIERADKPDKSILAIIPLFGERLTKASQNYTEESFVRNVISPLLKSRDHLALSWILQVLNKKSASWQAAPESDQSTFAQDLQAIYQETKDTDIEPILRKIAESIDIPTTIDKSDSVTDNAEDVATDQ